MCQNNRYHNVFLCSRCPNLYYCHYINRAFKPTSKMPYESCASVCPKCGKQCTLPSGHCCKHECPEGHTW